MAAQTEQNVEKGIDHGVDKDEIARLHSVGQPKP
jgi:hypothetical protein